MNDHIADEKIAHIQRLYNTNATAKELFDWLASREKGANFTNASRASQMTGENYYDVIALFRELDELGLGRFIPGRKGGKSRFEWIYDVRSLGNAAKGVTVALREVPPDATDDEDDGDEDSSTLSNDVLIHEFQLRTGSKIQLALPSDLTAREADRIGAWIRTLPFE